MNILLLHGALGSKAQVASLAERLSAHTVRAIDLSGHGGRPLPSDELSFEHFLQDIDAVLEAAGWTDAHLFGYSMGGYAALLYAAQHPGRVASVTTLGTKLLWDREGLDRELRMLDPGKMQAKVPAFVEQLAAEHGTERWEPLVHATAKLITGLHERPLLTPEVLARIGCPVLLCVGDRDTTAVPADTRIVAASIANARVEVLPDTPHPFAAVDLDRLTALCSALWK